MTDCCECDKRATRFWAGLAYCGEHLRQAMAEDPHGNDCPKCGVSQPTTTLWLGTSPCGPCKARARRARQMGERP